MKRPSPKAATVKAPKVEVQRLPHSAGLDLPSYQTADAAGLDLAAAVPENAAVTLAPGERALLPTGLSMRLPSGYEAQIRPRSGLALKHGITVLNSPGTIDADYRGEIQVLLINLGTASFVIQRGDRIAQMIVAPVSHCRIVETAILPASARGSGGFGSTGVFRKALQKKEPTKREERKNFSQEAPTAKRSHRRSNKVRD